MTGVEVASGFRSRLWLCCMSVLLTVACWRVLGGQLMLRVLGSLLISAVITLVSIILSQLADAEGLFYVLSDAPVTCCLSLFRCPC